MSSSVALVSWGAETHGAPAGLAVVGEDILQVGHTPDVLPSVAAVEAERHPRWVWWAAGRDARAVVHDRIRLQRCWDLAEAHRLIAGGWAAGPALVWATASGLPTASLPQLPPDDLFASVPDASDPDEPVGPDGYLRPETDSPQWCRTAERAVRWAQLALRTALLQESRLAAVGGARPDVLSTAHSESAAALMCLELERDGLPVDRAMAERLIGDAAGPRPLDEADADRIRRLRDQRVLRHTQGAEATDLRNPAQVRELLGRVGIAVPDTRKWRLQSYGGSHPVVDALLSWRASERIATTFGYRWLDTNVGPDDRLRGAWTACDGAAGRMTAQNGLHNLPAALRPAIAAADGHLFVRADLGQVEPRVLAVVARDEALAAASRAEDLYAPVSAALGVDRPVAKVAVLAAMYGQRSGTAGAALEGLQRAYPVAMGYLDRTYAEGYAGRSVRTFGGRLVPMSPEPPDATENRGHNRAAARGRYARNAVIQGSAAELFKAWAATVRHALAPVDAQIVLCLHDELLVHTPTDRAPEVAELVRRSLTEAALRWAGTDRVRFIADVSVVPRWSDVKQPVDEPGGDEPAPGEVDSAPPVVADGAVP